MLTNGTNVTAHEVAHTLQTLINNGDIVRYLGGAGQMYQSIGQSLFNASSDINNGSIATECGYAPLTSVNSSSMLPPPLQSINASWSFKITNLDWVPQYSNPDSPMHRQLTDGLLQYVPDIFHQILGEYFVDADVVQFAQGSIIVNGRLNFLDPVQSHLALIEHKFQQMIVGTNNSYIGPYHINSSSITLTLADGVNITSTSSSTMSAPPSTTVTTVPPPNCPSIPSFVPHYANETACNLPVSEMCKEGGGCTNGQCPMECQGLASCPDAEVACMEFQNNLVNITGNADLVRTVMDPASCSCFALVDIWYPTWQGSADLCMEANSRLAWLCNESIFGSLGTISPQFWGAGYVGGLQFGNATTMGGNWYWYDTLQRSICPAPHHQDIPWGPGEPNDYANPHEGGREDCISTWYHPGWQWPVIADSPCDNSRYHLRTICERIYTSNMSMPQSSTINATVTFTSTMTAGSTTSKQIA